jgi:hypothetical protein
MGLGNQQADRSARNAWLQHFDPLGGHPIEIIWAWVTSERIEALEPRALERLVGTNWNLLDFPSGSATRKMLGYSTSIRSVVAP